MKKLRKNNTYIYQYIGNSKILSELNGCICTICAEYLGQNYVGIKFKNGIETIAYAKELIPL